MQNKESDLLDRYLNAIKMWLPKAHQQDILAEIAEDLHSQVEDRESSLGHAIGEDDLVAILKKRGMPMTVASGYLQDQRLINPAMLPLYRMVLKIVLLWVQLPLFVIIFIGSLLSSHNPGAALASFWGSAWIAGFTSVGIITAIFVLLDRYHVNVDKVDKWNPRKLPRVPPSQATTSRWNHFAGFVFGTIATILWADLMWHRVAFTFPGGPAVTLLPIWEQIYWPILGLTLINAAADLISFLNPSWTRIRSCVRIAVDASMLVMAIVLSRVANWVTISAANASAADAAKAAVWIGLGVQITLFVIAFSSIWDAVVEVRRLLRAKPAQSTSLLTV
jgi:hypothetical protein